MWVRQGRESEGVCNGSYITDRRLFSCNGLGELDVGRGVG